MQHYVQSGHVRKQPVNLLKVLLNARSALILTQTKQLMLSEHHEWNVYWTNWQLHLASNNSFL